MQEPEHMLSDHLDCGLRIADRGLRTSVRKSAGLHAAVSWLVTALLLLHSCALPIHMNYSIARAGAGAVTKGCKKGTCCTSRCYVDPQGVHHCVPKPGESCECGMSASDPETAPELASSSATLTDADSLQPMRVSSRYVIEFQSLFQDHDEFPSTPPPRATPS